MIRFDSGPSSWSTPGSQVSSSGRLSSVTKCMGAVCVKLLRCAIMGYKALSSTPEEHKKLQKKQNNFLQENKKRFQKGQHEGESSITDAEQELLHSKGG